MAEEFIVEYKELLKDLSNTEKIKINTLTMLAEDNKPYAQTIVTAIEQHLGQCPSSHRLPALYLVDSIIKNVKEPFTSMFCKRLDQVFGKVWDSSLAQDRQKLTKLAGLWAPVLPAAVLARVQARMGSNSAGQASQAPTRLQKQPVSQQGSLVLQHIQQPQQPVLMHQPPVQLRSQQVPQQQHILQQVHPHKQQPVFQQQPQQLVAGGMLGAVSMQLQPGQQVIQGPGGVQVVSLQHAPAHPQPPQPLFVVGPHGQLIPVAQPVQPPQQQRQQQPQTIILQPASQQPVHGMPPHVVTSLPPISPAHPAWQQQQQVSVQPSHLLQPQQQQQHLPAGLNPMVRRSPAFPASPAAPSTSPHHTSSRSPHHRSGASPMHTSAPSSVARSSSPAAQAEHIAASLSSLLQGLTRTGYLDEALKATSFDPAFIKKEHKGAVALLKSASDGTRKRFKDIQYQRNKRRRDATTSTALLSRSWYLPVDIWITGTTVPEAAAAEPEDEEEEDEDAAPVPKVDKDPSQTQCAISHEPFEEVFDADRDAWVYMGVVRLHGEEAERYGVPEGSLVKVECLAEANLGSSPAALAVAAAGPATTALPDEADLAAAAAAAPAAGQQQHDPQDMAAGVPPPAAAAEYQEGAAAAVGGDVKPHMLVKMEVDGVSMAAQLQSGAPGADGVKQEQQGMTGSNDTHAVPVKADQQQQEGAAAAAAVSLKREADASNPTEAHQEVTPTKKQRTSVDP